MSKKSSFSTNKVCKKTSLLLINNTRSNVSRTVSLMSVEDSGFYLITVYITARGNKFWLTRLIGSPIGSASIFFTFLSNCDNRSRNSSADFDVTTKSLVCTHGPTSR
uniref:Uncharacterized protein n=1 Tax=Romanomermis culicivorax TaxID=13658 RepID=A0A915IYD0_ROMCU